jgi:hypothetical protein
MGVLANRDFIKMNGLGNEIVVVDLRQGIQQDTQHDAQQGAQPIGADEARAAARQEPYDQLMALYPGEAAATPWSGFTTTMARRPAPAATACAASLRWSAPRPARRN